MKKKALIIGIVLFLCIGAVGTYAVLDRLFPMAQPVSCPTADEIMSVSVGINSGESIILNEELFFDLLEKISEAEPTRKMSVNDYPTAETYYKVEISADRMYCYFIYEESGQVYVELPYEGVYKSDNSIIDYIEEIY